MYKSKETGFNGILNYIYNKYPNIIPKTKDVNQEFAFVRKLQRKFLNSINVKFTKNKEHYKTQKNWIKFKDFLKENYEY